MAHVGAPLMIPGGIERESTSTPHTVYMYVYETKTLYSVHVRTHTELIVFTALIEATMYILKQYNLHTH